VVANKSHFQDGSSSRLNINHHFNRVKVMWWI